MPITAPSPSNQFYARDRKTWREWLQKNHAEAKNIWLVLYHKESGKPSVTYDEAVEAPLFVWQY